MLSISPYRDRVYDRKNFKKNADGLIERHREVSLGVVEADVLDHFA
jgi:hypothetical protein